MTDVATPGKSYQAMQTRWKQMRDCVAGSHAIKAAGTTYLPALSGHEVTGSGGRTTLTTEYDGYKMRALFYGATGRTIDGLSGMVFRRPPIVDLPPASTELAADVDMLGRKVEEFSDAVLREVLTTGRVGILADHTRQTEDFSEGPVGARRPDELRPYLALYQTEAVLDVVHEVVGGARKLVQARLLETMEVPGQSEFEVDQVQIVRVLELVQGVYRQRVFVAEEREDERTKASVTTWTEDEALAVTPTRSDGRTFGFIPLWIVGTGAGVVPGEIEPPPLLDLSDVNLAHYRQDADLRNALHMAGVPTPYCLGMEDPGTPVRFGSAQFLWFGGETVKEVGFLSYGAEGVVHIQKALTDLESQMAFLGARMLQPDRPGVEAAETARIHRMGEISILARLSNVVSNNLTAAVRFMLEWAGIPAGEKHQVRLNDDFLPTQAPAQLLTAMVAAWQAKGVSHDSLWRFAQEGELVDPRRTAEEEMAILDKEQDAQLERQRDLIKRGLMPDPMAVTANGSDPDADDEEGNDGAAQADAPARRGERQGAGRQPRRGGANGQRSGQARR